MSHPSGGAVPALKQLPARDLGRTEGWVSILRSSLHLPESWRLVISFFWTTLWFRKLTSFTTKLVNGNSVSRIDSTDWARDSEIFSRDSVTSNSNFVKILYIKCFKHTFLSLGNSNQIIYSQLGPFCLKMVQHSDFYTWILFCSWHSVFHYPWRAKNRKTGIHSKLNDNTGG